MVIDASFVKRHIKPKADSSLLNMKKAELIEYIRMLEHNYNVAVSFNEQQARNIEVLMKNGVIPQQWISVEDRLPEPCVSVLTLRRRLEDGACSQRVDSTIPIYDGTFVWFSDTHSWKTKVTHWMPLPEPPEED